MWALFTAALTRASSTTRVSIINTSSNFMLTAFLGLIIFRESLPPLWWLGAVGLVVGNVIIGRREEREGSKGEREEAPLMEGEEGYRDEAVDGEVDDDALELDGDTDGSKIVKDGEDGGDKR